MTAWASIIGRVRELDDGEPERPKRGRRGAGAEAKRREWREWRRPQPEPKPATDMARAHNGNPVAWSRWGHESREKFRERVFADAARLGIVADAVAFSYFFEIGAKDD